MYNNTQKQLQIRDRSTWFLSSFATYIILPSFFYIYRHKSTTSEISHHIELSSSHSFNQWVHNLFTPFVQTQTWVWLANPLSFIIIITTHRKTNRPTKNCSSNIDSINYKSKKFNWIMATTSGPYNYSYIFKYIIIGDMGVGKSCLLHQFTDKKCMMNLHILYP